MSIIACSVGGCEKPRIARGWCVMHYSRWKRHGDPLVKTRPKSESPCSIEGCERERYGRMDVCNMHYKRFNRNGTYEKVKVKKICTVGDCGSPAYGRGMCNVHWKRWYKNGTTEKVRVRKLCVIDGCEKFRVGGGLCSVHYYRKQRHGDPIARRQGEIVDGKKICARCKVDKPLSEWSKNLSYCRKCASRDSVERLQNHPQRAEIQRNKNLIRRARKANATIENFTRDEILNRDKWICGICTEDIDKSLTWPHPEYASIDHIIPLAKGGEHSRKNVQAAHYRCNCRKKDSLPGE